MENTQPLVEMAVSLTELAVKGTASTVTKKVRAIKEEKNLEKVRATYDELINEVILEREEAVSIAQAYKAELDRIVISDEDIKHLHNTVSKLLEIVNTLNMAKAQLGGDEAIKKAQADAQSYAQLQNLISVDTLKTMQLLGFNYKAAIGEPLTEICANAITAFGKRSAQSKTSSGKK